MCCFSFARSKLAAGHNPLTSVSNTNIFARGSRAGRQYLVYSMTLKAEDELAMILPIPVPEKTDEHAVKFIDLKEYADFFVDLKKGFPTRAVPRVHSRSIRSGGGSEIRCPSSRSSKLAAFRPRSYPRSPISNGWTSGSGSPKKSGTICRNTRCTASRSSG